MSSSNQQSTDNKIKIDNSEYYFDSLPDEAKKLVAGLRTADTQLRMHEDTLKVLAVGRQHLAMQLKSKLESINPIK